MVDMKNPPEGAAPGPDDVVGIAQPYLWEPIARFGDPDAVLRHAQQEGLLVAIRWTGGTHVGEFKYRVVAVHEHHFVAEALSVSAKGERFLGNQVMFKTSLIMAIALVNAAGSAKERGEMDLKKYKTK